MLSAPSSTTSVASMSPRLSRVNSTMGSFSQRSLQSFRTVSLPGLLPGTDLGILSSGLLDKRRDGAVRGGWAKRLFILSTRSLHYYRKTEEYELFGKERGQVALSEIAHAKIIAPDDAPYGAVEPGMPSFFFAVVSKKKSLLMFLRADTLELATNWVNTINQAVHVAKTINFSPRWPADVLQKFTAAASGNFEETNEEEDTPEMERVPNVVPSILVISMASTTDYSPQSTTERLVKRQVELEKELELGSFKKKDFCILVLSDGEEIHVPQHLLGADPQSLTKEPKEVVLSTPPRSRTLNSNIVSLSRVHATFRCAKRPPVVIAPRSSDIQPTRQSQQSALLSAFPGGIGGLFLLSCIVAFWLAHPFEGLMKITIVVGLILAISQVSQFIMSSIFDSKVNTQKLQPNPAPTGASSKLDEEYIYYICINRIEVIDQDQEHLPQTPSTAEETAGDDDTTTADEQDSALNAISGGPLPFSQRFIAAEKGDEEKGRQRYENTLQWRAENNIDNILIRPHPTFETIKRYYPQYFHGRSKADLPVYYEQPGKIDLPGLKREGLAIEDLLQHYMYITEYLWRVIEPSDTGRSVTVLDVSGIGMSDLGGEVLDFIKRASAFTGAHYPERSAHIFIINIPGWFNMIWRMIKPLIDPVTREKIHMLKGSAILKELETLIDMDNIPSDLGGRGCQLGESKEEHALRAHVAKYLNA